MSFRPQRADAGAVLGELAKRVRVLERVFEWWHDATLESPWVNSGDPNHPVQYTRTVLGSLRFRGAATDGSAGQVLFYLPASYWPSKDEDYVASRGTTPIVLRVLASDGSVTPLS